MQKEKKKKPPKEDKNTFVITIISFMHCSQDFATFV
jgi:hypothetical protein